MKRSYSSGMAFALASFASIGVIVTITAVLTARIYGVTVLGEGVLALAPVAIVTLLSTTREQPAMVRVIAKLEPRDPAVTGIWLAVFSFSSLLTSVATALGIGASYLIFNGPIDHPDLFAPAAVALLSYLLIVNPAWNVDGVLGAFLAGKELFAVRLHQAVMYGVLIVGLSFVDHSVWSLTFAYVGSWLTSLVHRLALLPRVVRLRVPRSEIRAGFAKLREIVVFGLKITPGSIASGLSDSSGTWILGVSSTVNAVGAYSRASMIATRLGEFNWRITEMLLPTLVQRQATGDTEGYNRVLADSLRYVAFGLLLPAAVAGGAAEAVMAVVFGSAFAPAAGALVWVLFAPVLQSLTAIQGVVLISANQPIWTTIAQIARLIVTVVAGVVLTNALGMTGMGLAVALGCFSSLAIFAIVIRSRAAFPSPRFASLLRQLVGLAAAYAGGFAVARAITDNVDGVPGLVLALIMGSLAYVITAIAVGGTKDRDRARLRQLMVRASPRFAPH
ncbi:MAG TPA: lipopolysaccharide biosynthesis protein [Thermoleophilaceae bacterium]|nr:lipopolysaccharide biosynthesis protein [Thermoleophilaceae bacterium]